MKIVLGLLLMIMLMGCSKHEKINHQSIKTALDYSYEQLHELMKGYSQVWYENEIESDQQKGIPAPPIEKPIPENAERIDLTPIDQLTVGNASLHHMIGQRRSRREFTDDSLSLEELSYLLWGTQGISKIENNTDGTVRYHLRTVPSGGARHPFETYLIINRIRGLKPGIYRYLPIEHQLVLIRETVNLSDQVSQACLDQEFVGESAVVFIWVAIPYRMEWRYTHMGYKDILIEAGHICQNLYLMAESIGAGTCAIAAYDQIKTDSLIGVDGTSEFTVYLAPVGRVQP